MTTHHIHPRRQSALLPRMGLLATIVIFGLCAWRSQSGQAADAPAAAAVTLPQISEKTFNVQDFGAVGGGIANDTPAIEKAIDACTKAGGGTVILPPGRYLTGPFKLASNLNLHLERNARLMLVDDMKRYPLYDVPEGTNRAKAEKGYVNWITAAGCHDIAITGEGTIDGQGPAWWKVYSKHRIPGRPEATDIFPHRPHMIVLSDCTRVLIEGVSLFNSPNFHLVPERCRDVTIRNIEISAQEDAPNTDGIDPSGWNFLITRCWIDVGDDNIAVKPVTDPAGEEVSCENFLISDCVFTHGHGMSIGGQTPGGLRNLIVRNCTFDGTEAGIRFKAGRGNGGIVENVTCEDLKMKNVKVAIFVSSFYPTNVKDPTTMPTTQSAEKIPVWRNCTFSNITAEGGETAGHLFGLPEAYVENFTFKNVTISASKPFDIAYAKGIKFVDSSVKLKSNAPAVIFKQAEISGIDASAWK